ncbi:MAG: hypothetical protein U0R17_00235 [Acidimicrobiia bacterium]
MHYIIMFLKSIISLGPTNLVAVGLLISVPFVMAYRKLRRY